MRLVSSAFSTERGCVSVQGSHFHTGPVSQLISSFDATQSFCFYCLEGFTKTPRAYMGGLQLGAIHTILYHIENTIYMQSPGSRLECAAHWWRLNCVQRVFGDICISEFGKRHHVAMRVVGSCFQLSGLSLTITNHMRHIPLFILGS